MQISGIDAGEPISSFAPTQSTNQTLGKDAFMQLLVAQLENQDPLEPVDNSAYVAQLAQFSQLEQMQALNDNVVGLAVLQQGNALLAQLTDGSALIGKEVTYADPQSGDTKQGTVESVKIVDGLAVLDIDGQDVPLGNVLEVRGESPATDPETAAEAGE